MMNTPVVVVVEVEEAKLYGLFLLKLYGIVIEEYVAWFSSERQLFNS